MVAATILPPARSVFYDANGNPVSGGVVHTYIPGGTVAKITWQDAAATIPNANPIILDSAGSALIYGAGAYQLTVTDALGVAVPGYSGVTTDTGLFPISAAMAPVVNAATVNVGFNLLAASGPLTTTPAISFLPICNALPTLGSLVVEATSSATASRQFLVSIGMNSDTGFGAPTYTGDRVAFYAAIDAKIGSGPAWAMNTVLNFEAGAATSGTQPAITGYECDFNNLNVNLGSTFGVGGLANPTGYGLQVTGASTHASTAGICVAGPSTQWYRGIMSANGSIHSSFAEYSVATNALECGGQHTTGLNLSGMTSAQSIYLANNQPIIAENAGGTLAFQLINCSNIDTVSLGGVGASAVVSQNIFLPGLDNTYAMGGTSNRWTALWAVNGTIQTSDPTLKTDILALPAMLPVVAAINPVTFKWICGGADMEEITETQSVHVREPRTFAEERIEMVAGQAVMRPHTRTVMEPAFDEVAVYDAAGAQVFDTIAARPAVLDPLTGVVILPARPERTVARIHRAPRMAEQQVTVRKPVERPGRRTHWGFLAPDVKAAFDAIGMDFGGYVRAEDGIEHLRPDQLIPVLWKAVAELAAEFAAYTAAHP